MDKTNFFEPVYSDYYNLCNRSFYFCYFFSQHLLVILNATGPWVDALLLTHPNLFGNLNTSDPTNIIDIVQCLSNILYTYDFVYKEGLNRIQVAKLP